MTLDEFKLQGNELINECVFSDMNRTSKIGNYAFKLRELIEEAYKQGREDSQAKYKWHDLRKNIDDLPDTSVDKVLVQYSNGEVWTNLPDNVPLSLDIIRWKYIDIEEVEE